MNPRHYLEDLLAEDSWRKVKNIRRELHEFLPQAFEDEDSIWAYADHNIELDTINIDSPIMKLEVDEKSLRFILSAIYHAVSLYYERPIKHGTEKVKVRVVDQNIVGEKKRKNTATHITWGYDKHEVTIPLRFFKSKSGLLYAGDAEFRHVTHDNLRFDSGASGSIASRAYHVIAECIDEGERVAKLYAAFASKLYLDPFVNDFSLAEDESGHDTTMFVQRFFNLNPIAKRMQLHWMSRLPIRKVGPVDASYMAIKEQAGRLKSSDINDIVDEETGVVFMGLTPYAESIECLKDFYRGKPRSAENEALKKVMETIAEVRNFAVLNRPYEVEERFAVELDGKKLIKFCSQLDYVVLKLTTQKPKELYAESRLRESEW